MPCVCPYRQQKTFNRQILIKGSYIEHSVKIVLYLLAVSLLVKASDTWVKTVIMKTTVSLSPPFIPFCAVALATLLFRFFPILVLSASSHELTKISSYFSQQELGLRCLPECFSSVIFRPQFLTAKVFRALRGLRKVPRPRYIDSLCLFMSVSSDK